VISFPDDPHPDFWMAVPIGASSLPIPHECKRLNPADAKESVLEDVAPQIEQAFRAREGSVVHH
jgi:hypothetical protein